LKSRNLHPRSDKGERRGSLELHPRSLFVAERVGFEPTVTTRATTIFETAPIGRSGTSMSEARP
jgi:hypothetical protein